jgi:hypothetical protein
MKRWVKIWLFGVNVAFLAAVFFLPDPIARYTLVAYIAAGPWLLTMMLAQRGLTRLLGVAHLVPWVPLVAYVSAGLAGEAAGPRITMGSDPALFGYALVLLAVVGTCLVLDVYDVYRWLAGERFRLGSLKAAEAGASGR